MIRQTSGSIGYLEHTFAVQSSLTPVALRNRSGAFVLSSVDSIQAAVPPDLPEDLRGTLLNRPGTAAYPIVSFTWLVLYKDQAYDGRTRERAAAIYDLVSWIIGDGQALAEPLQYSPLPDRVRKDGHVPSEPAIMGRKAHQVAGMRISRAVCCLNRI